MRSTFKVLFYVKKGSEKPNGNLPLMCRITVDGEIKQFSCKMDVPPRLWDVKNSRASGKSVEAQRINLAVDKIRVEVNRRYQELMQTDGYVTAAKLKDAYLGIGVKQGNLAEALRAAQRRVRQEGRAQQGAGKIFSDAIRRFAAIFGSFCPIPTHRVGSGVAKSVLRQLYTAAHVFFFFYVCHFSMIILTFAPQNGFFAVGYGRRSV